MSLRAEVLWCLSSQCSSGHSGVQRLGVCCQPGNPQGMICLPMIWVDWKTCISCTAFKWLLWNMLQQCLGHAWAFFWIQLGHGCLRKDLLPQKLPFHPTGITFSFGAAQKSDVIFFFFEYTWSRKLLIGCLTLKILLSFISAFKLGKRGCVLTGVFLWDECEMLRHSRAGLLLSL